MSLDPLMDEFPSISPYAAFDNNPILLNDQDGDFPGLGALFEYAWQVGTNLYQGKSLYNSFIGDVDFVAVSALPGGKGVWKALKIAGEIYSSVTETTFNKGVRVKSGTEIAAGYLLKYGSKKIVKGLKKVSSDKVYKKIKNKHAKTVKQLEKQKNKVSKKSKNHKSSVRKLNNLEEKAEGLKRKVELTEKLNKTLGKLDDEGWDYVDQNTGKVLENLSKPLIDKVGELIDPSIEKATGGALPAQTEDASENPTATESVDVSNTVSQEKVNSESSTSGRGRRPDESHKEFMIRHKQEVEDKRRETSERHHQKNVDRRKG